MKHEGPVTVTVRPDGTYYVEKAKTSMPTGTTQIEPVVRRGPSPIAVAITTSLRDLAGIAVTARAVAPALGKYGVVAAIGLGVLNAWAETHPPKPPTALHRIRLRRIPR